MVRRVARTACLKAGVLWGVSKARLALGTYNRYTVGTALDGNIVPSAVA